PSGKRRKRLRQWSRRRFQHHPFGQPHPGMSATVPDATAGPHSASLAADAVGKRGGECRRLAGGGFRQQCDWQQSGWQQCGWACP
ncbi:MAG: hypothetical protein ACKOFW_04610, partial [Planctomycetaceae bacterium]